LEFLIPRFRLQQPDIHCGLLAEVGRGVFERTQEKGLVLSDIYSRGNGTFSVGWGGWLHGCLGQSGRLFEL